MNPPLPRLDQVLTDPGSVTGLSPEGAAKLLTQIAVVQSAISARLVAAVAATNGNGAAPIGPDETLGVPAIARLLNRTPRWVWRSQKKLPFLRRVGRGLLASRSELERWIATQKIK